MNKKLISSLLTIAMAINIFAIMPLNAFAIGSKSEVYEKDGYTVTYRIGSEWDNNRSVEVTIENTGEEAILNWALKYDTGGEVYNLWNSKIYDSTEEYTIIKNNGYNYEIEPGRSANYGYIVTGAETLIPENIELCCRRIDVKSGYDVDFNVTSDWHTGFQAEIAITNTSAEPIEAWTLGFDSNFDINNIWNAKLLSSEEQSYVTANQLWTTPINPGASASFGFTADKSATENAWAENFTLTAVIVGESSLEKEPEIDYELDTDSDGLPDYYEEIIGSDPKTEHSDDDQLPDGYEALYLGTDPSKSDSDDNVISDADEDFDTDGLTNLEEYNLGTDPFLEDSDYDTLSDKDEVNIHGTNPTKGDTDDDLVPDGDEVKLGLDPNSGSTNGTPDSERTFSQIVTAESEVLAAVNDDAETPFDVSLEITAAGVAESNVYARESGYSNAIENPSIIGIAPEFVYTDGLEVEEVTVKFELDDSIVDNTLGTYVSSSTEFEGIKRLNVFMFFEDVNMLLPVETFHDEATNTVYTTTDRMGTYCLVDMELFFNNLDIAPSDDEIEEDYDIETQEFLDEPVFSSYNISELKINTGYTDKKDNFDVVFLIDSRDVVSVNKYAVIKKNIIEATDTIFITSPNARVKIIEMLSSSDTHSSNGAIKVVTRGDIGETIDADSDYFYNLDEVYSALEFVTNNSSSGKKDCLISDAVNYIYKNYGERETYVFTIVQPKKLFYQKESKNAYDSLDEITNNKLPINISTIFADKHTSKYGYALDIAAKTGGITNYTYENTAELILKHIYGYTPTVENGYKAITATGYQTVVLNNSLQENYDWYHNSAHYDVFRDTDVDGLADFEEIMFTNDKGYSLIDDSDPNHVKLLSFYDILDIVGDKLFYVEIGLERYCDTTGEKNKYPMSLLNVPVLPIYSDPMQPDADGDGLLDGSAQYVNGKIVVPKDYERLKHNGPSDVKSFWDNQIQMQREKEYQTLYGTESQLEKDFEEFFKKVNFENNIEYWWTFLYKTNELDGDYKGISDVLIKMFAKAPLTNIIKNTEFGTEWGAAFLRFRRSQDGKTYHARPDRDYKQWQYYLGYFDLYDSVFQRGTNALKKKVYYEYNGEQYILWCWKGDYMNLGLGSEFGIYRIVKDNEYELYDNWKFEEFTMVDINRKMTNSTYYYDKNIANWQPEEKVWWATVFNPAYKNKYKTDVENMLVLGTIDFSTTADDRDMYKSFKNDVVNENENYKEINYKNIEANAKEQLIFDDDNHMVWLMWWGE